MALGKRFFAGFGAALFLVTSSALTIVVVLTLSNNSNTASTNLNTTSKNSTTCPSGYNVSDGSKLEGFSAQTKSVSRLELSDLQAGTGTAVKSGSTVVACYVGALAKNGVVFDSSGAHGGPATFSLSSVIVGWQLGIPGMKVGGARELLIPAAMAYGSKANGSIPANSDLVFYVLVLSVTN
ncbi:MAG: FKBP-type peptidyl-prolyl cis-trans isomerase [Candidatus Saccharimonadales bacterium]